MTALTPDERLERDARDRRITQVETVDAWNAPAAERLAAIEELFAIGAEAMSGEWIAQAQTCAFLIMERLKAHKFMVRNVEP